MCKKFAIVEVGSTNTKAYLYENGIIIELGFKTIEFKKNYNVSGKLHLTDIKILVDYINSIFCSDIDVYVYGTSIFRELTTEDAESFGAILQHSTSCVHFDVVSAKEENELTVIGAIENVPLEGNICVFIGGGGSTEISICNNKRIIEMINIPLGVSHIIKKYPDLSSDLAITDINTVTEYIMNRLILPKNKADYMILAGGDFILRYENAKYPIMKNYLFHSERHPYVISYDKDIEYEKKYYHDIHLSDLKSTTPDNPKWWDGTRSMCAFTNAVAMAVGAKVLIPTRTSMIFGIASKLVMKSTDRV